MTFKKKLLFTLCLTTGMAGSMSWLGMAKSMGLNHEMWRLFWLSVGPTIIFAFFLNLLVVSNLSSLLIKWATRRMVDEAAIQLKAGTIRSWAMLLGMCFTMSTRALLMNGAIFHMTAGQFILGFFGTLTMAYFIRDLFMMPLATYLVRRLMPV